MSLLSWRQRPLSLGLGMRLGAQKKTVIPVFMQDEAVKKFRVNSVWQAGVDGSVALVELGAGGLDQHDQR